MFASDRDLLVLEPGVFVDAGWAAQELFRGSGSISAGVLTCSGGAFRSARVGGVVQVDRAMYEIVQTVDDNRVGVSLLRSTSTAAFIPPADRGSSTVIVRTFAAQTGLVHAQLLRMLGLAPGDGDAVTLGESRVCNPQDLALCESLGTLHLVYASASAVLGDLSAAATRARMYLERFNAERWRVAARVDTDGDGVPDCVRRASVSQLVRV